MPAARKRAGSSFALNARTAPRIPAMNTSLVGRSKRDTKYWRFTSTDVPTPCEKMVSPKKGSAQNATSRKARRQVAAMSTKLRLRSPLPQKSM